MSAVPISSPDIPYVLLVFNAPGRIYLLILSLHFMCTAIGKSTYPLEKNSS